jgi:AcrR family transcriptional regulator
MATSERKKRQIRQREELILDIARKMLVERGYPGMSMDRLADATEYSKGTIYQHFTCKEDLILALSIQTMSKREEFFRRAATFRGRTRERIIAVGVAEDLFVRLYPYHFRSEQIVRLTSLRDKTTPLRNETLDACEQRCLSIVTEIVRTAIVQEDVVLRDGMTPEDICFGLWCMTLGAHTLMASEIPLSERGVRDGAKVLRFSTKYFLDGMAWQPLMNDVDFGATVVRIREEIFPSETQQVFGNRTGEKNSPAIIRQASLA